MPHTFINFTQQDTDCFYTTVRNTSGGERAFGFLGDRGKRLGANELITIPGNLINHLGGGGQWSQRRFKALESAVQRGSLEIVSTPAVHLYDPVNDETKTLALEAGTLGTVDPCWVKQSLSSSSSSGDGHP